MKRTIIALLFTVNAFAAFSQDREPAQRPIKYNKNSNYYITTDSPDFKQDKFYFSMLRVAMRFITLCVFLYLSMRVTNLTYTGNEAAISTTKLSYYIQSLMG